MLIQTKTVLKDYKGKNLLSGTGENKHELTIGEVLTEVLNMYQVGGKMKLFCLAKNFTENESVELDEADLSLVKKAVEAHQGYSNVVLGQILVMLEK